MSFDAVATHKAIIFDWDDTICPSSFVDRYKIERMEKLPRNFQRLFEEITRLTERVLREASKYGEVILITNSDEGWVKYSCERYLPRLLPVLEGYRIVSARTLYERFYPGQPLCWKAAAFAHEVNELYESMSASDDSAMNGSMESTDVSSTDSEEEKPSMDEEEKKCINTNLSFLGEREIISFGDSMEERTAVRIVAEQLGATPKSVMFIQLPTPVQILGQLQMVAAHMKFVCEHKTSLDLEITTEQAQRCADAHLRRYKLGSYRQLQYLPRSGTDEAIVPGETTLEPNVVAS